MLVDFISIHINDINYFLSKGLQLGLHQRSLLPTLSLGLSVTSLYSPVFLVQIIVKLHKEESINMSSKLKQSNGDWVCSDKRYFLHRVIPRFLFSFLMTSIWRFLGAETSILRGELLVTVAGKVCSCSVKLYIFKKQFKSYD